jgi:hypothetical protein
LQRIVKATLASLLIIFAIPVFATDEPPLPGTRTPVDMLQGSKGILVATLLSLGERHSGPVGASRFESRWKVRRTLRGQYPDEVTLTFLLRTLPEDLKERLPAVGQTYIIVTHPTAEYSVERMFDDSEENLTYVQRLLGDSAR